MLVHSFSDAQPGTLTVYNKESGKFTVLGIMQPTIDPKQMGQRDETTMVR